MSRHQTCASCVRFPLAEAVENGGEAQCGGYERPAKFDDGFCVLYNRAADVAARRPLVAKLMQLQGEKA